MLMAAVTLRFNIWTKHRNLSGKIFPIAFPSGQRMSAPTQAGTHSLGAVQIFPLELVDHVSSPSGFNNPAGVFYYSIS